MTTEYKDKAVVLLSGGLDSALSLAIMVSDPEIDEVHALIFDYGQSSQAEVGKAVRLCEAWLVPFTVQRMKLSTDADTHVEIPARNLIFVAQAAAFALSHGFTSIVIGAEPDSTYADSSVEFLQKADAMLRCFNLRLVAPVKLLANKKELVMEALARGVPLHLCHSSRSDKVDGECKTSRRFLDALGSIFPRIDPLVLLDVLNRLSSPSVVSIARPNVGASICYRLTEGSFSFKLPAALMVVGSMNWVTYPQQVIVYTTGSWGKALKAAQALIGDSKDVAVIQSYWLVDLLGQPINCDLLEAQWGIKQAMSMLPRPRYMPRVACRVTQGHLAHALTSLGYEVVLPNDPRPNLLLETVV